jgi:hypothetical protein
MNRQVQAREILGEGLPEVFPLRNIDDPGWLRDHPGGFAPSSRASEGSFYGVNLERFTEMTRHLDGAAYGRYCEAVRAWQRNTTLDILMQLPGDLIVAKFEQDFPGDAAVLRTAAGANRIPFQHFLGVD